MQRCNGLARESERRIDGGRNERMCKFSEKILILIIILVMMARMAGSNINR